MKFESKFLIKIQGNLFSYHIYEVNFSHFKYSHFIQTSNNTNKLNVNLTKCGSKLEISFEFDSLIKCRQVPCQRQKAR